MRGSFVLAGIVAAGSFGGLSFAAAAPASASCSPSFTSIPCTIATNIAAAPPMIASGLANAPQQLAGGLSAAPGQFAGTNCAVGPAGTCGITAAPGQFIGNPTSCAYVDVGDGPTSTAPCGITAVPGQFFGSGVTQIVTAPQTIAGALAAAPGQFVSAILNGGTAPSSPTQTGPTDPSPGNPDPGDPNPGGNG